MADPSGTAFDTDQFDTIYPAGVERHYWNRCRNAVIAHRLRSLKAAGPMLEVGCGKGLVVAALRTMGFDITGVELASVAPVPEAAEFVRANTDALQLDPAFRATVRTILLLDVVEHIEDPVAFLNALKIHFPALQWMVFTVPARQELFSNYDHFNHHFRRYDPVQLRSHVAVHGTERVTWSYFFHALYPAARVQLKSSGARTIGFTVPGKGPASWIHALLGWLFLLEFHLLPGSWKGTSLIMGVELAPAGSRLT